MAYIATQLNKWKLGYFNAKRLLLRIDLPTACDWFHCVWIATQKVGGLNTARVCLATLAYPDLDYERIYRQTDDNDELRANCLLVRFAKIRSAVGLSGFLLGQQSGFNCRVYWRSSGLVWSMLPVSLPAT